MPRPQEDSITKQEWLARKLRTFKNTAPSAEISLQPRPDHLPLSFAQIRLWFLEQLDPESSAYLLPYAWKLQGNLDISALTNSLDQLLARHESLRTTFSTYEDYPVQIIKPSEQMVLPLIDLSDQIEAVREAECQRLIQEETMQGFNLQTGPLIRAKLLRLGTEDHVLLLTLHHIITDGWSMSIFFKEFSASYTAQVTGPATKLLPLPLQFADFAVWQRHRLQGEEFDRQLQYWQRKLNNIPPHLEFPTDNPHPPQQTFRGSSISFPISSDVRQSLQVLCRDQGMTLFMPLMAAFHILLFRYSGQRDILVGTPVAGRSHSTLESIIGFFVNMLVLRSQFRGNPTFQEILSQIRETCLQAYDHQELPFDKLVETLKPVRDLSRHPLFQAMFQLHHNEASQELILPHLHVKSIKRETGVAKFDLSLAFVSTQETLEGNFFFNTDIFEFSTIKRLAANFQTLLEGLILHPTRPVGHIPILTDHEQQQLLSEWNATTYTIPSTSCVHELFGEQVALTPDAIALVEEEQHVTYRALDVRTDQLAHYLQTQGVGLEVRVGLWLPRGIDLIVSMLGVLKAGGVYMPLDPATPPERLGLMLEDAVPLLVLTSESLHAPLLSCLDELAHAELRRSRLVVVDSAREQPPPVASSFTLPNVHPENLAYVMYTSGSMGKPKGVEIPHRSIVRLVNKPTYLPWSQSAVFLQLASPAFDAATFEIWTCLVNGGKLILGPSHLPSLDDLGALLKENQITTLWLTAGLFHQVVDWNVDILRPLKHLLAGGDVLSPHHVQQVIEQLPTCHVINGYGPTENTTFTCFYSIVSGGNYGSLIPIGKPIDQTQVYVFDSLHHLLPMGAQGELCIGGFGLARGYQYLPNVTAEQFIPHPYSSKPGTRLYRSGDIARYCNDGNLEFLGRRDNQVKVRGYRVECGEIETVLMKHPTVQETIVVPRKDNFGNNRLVAYIVPEKGLNPKTSDLREFLNQTLPSYMVPTEYIILNVLPLTANGKVDRNKLPTEDQRHFDEEPFIPPRNALENQLTEIWQNVLGHHPIGVTDNFFNLGGESLMAVRLCSEVERAMKQKIPVTLIFHAQTIEQFAKKLENREEDIPSSLLVPIQPKGSLPPIFCVCFGDSFTPYLTQYSNQPLYMFFNQGYDGQPAQYDTVEEIAQGYIKDMRIIQPQGPYFMAGYSFGGLVAYEMAQQLYQEGETIGFLGLVDATTSRSKGELQAKNIDHGNSFTTGIIKDNPVATRSSLHWSDFLSKVLGGLTWRFAKLKKSLTTVRQNLICNAFLGLGYPLPPSQRRDYCMRIVVNASQQYRLKKYPGAIRVFQTNSYMEYYWRKFCGEVIEVYSFPTKHLDIAKEPNTQRLLLKLMNSVQMAQEKISDKYNE